MKIEVIYAGRQRQAIIPVQLDDGATIAAAIDRSGILVQFPEIDLGSQKVGIFGRARPLDTVLRAGDRVEIYRPASATRAADDEQDDEA